MAMFPRIMKAFQDMLRVEKVDEPNLKGLVVCFADKKSGLVVPAKVLGGGQGGGVRRRVKRRDNGRVCRVRPHYLRFV